MRDGATTARSVNRKTNPSNVGLKTTRGGLATTSLRVLKAVMIMTYKGTSMMSAIASTVSARTTPARREDGLTLSTRTDSTIGRPGPVSAKLAMSSLLLSLYSDNGYIDC